MSASEQVAGFVVPGAKIAIFDSFNAVDGKTPIPSGEKLSFSRDAVQTTRILFPSVEVIAVGTRGAPNAATSDTVNQTATSGVAGTGTGTGTGAANGPQSSDGGSLLVTVAVDQAEAERLVHAVQTGTLYLALVNDATKVSPGPGVNNKSLFTD